MKLKEAVEKSAEGYWREAQIRVNPADRQQWFVTLCSNENKYFILADDDDKAITLNTIEEITRLINHVGLDQFTVYIY